MANLLLFADCQTLMSLSVWLTKVIESPLADHLPTARSRDRWPQGKSCPRTNFGAGRSEHERHARMEFNDWTFQSVVVLVVGVIVTAGLFAVTAYVFVRGER